MNQEKTLEQPINRIKTNLNYLKTRTMTEVSQLFRVKTSIENYIEVTATQSFDVIV